MSDPTQKPSVDRHAEAIAQVSEMRDIIHMQKSQIEALMRDAQTGRDRVAILTEERARWRTEALACRTFVVKLATILEHVNTATVGAAMILTDMAKMDEDETPAVAVEETTKAVEDNLEKLRRMTDGPVMETVSPGTPSIS